MAVEKAKNVPPFVLWCSATIPTAFDDSMSYYEALCALYKWIQDNIIGVVNNNADILQEYIKMADELKKFVEDYFKNLDVQEEINNKLDEMARDGSLEELLGNALKQLVEETEQRLDAMEERSVDFPRFYIGAFFKGGYGQSNTTKVHFYTSLDGVDFTEFNESNDLDSVAGEDLRDPSIVWDEKGKRFLLACTAYNESHDFLLFESPDLKNWTKHEVNLGNLQPHSSSHRWAPDLFIDDDGTIYVTISMEYSRVGSDYYMIPVLFKCNDTTNLTFQRVGEIVLNDTSDTRSYRDTSIAKINNVYYLLVTRNSDNITELYSVNNIEYVTSYSRVRAMVNYPDYDALEGFNFCVTDNDVNIYSEQFKLLHCYTMTQTPITDFPSNFNPAAKYLSSLSHMNQDTLPEFRDARHGSVIYLTSQNARQAVLNNTDANFSNTNAIEYGDYRTGFDFYYGSTPSTVIAYPGISYNMGSLTGTVTIDNLINPFNCGYVKFCTSSSPLKIVVNKVNGNIVNKTFVADRSNIGGTPVIFDFFNNAAGDFRTGKYAVASLSDVTDSGNGISVTRMSGDLSHGVVSLDFDITVTTTAESDIEVGTINKAYLRPSLPVTFVANGRNINVNITKTGVITINARGLASGSVTRCSAIYKPTD